MSENDDDLTPDQLRDWMAGHGLLPTVPAADPDEREALLARITAAPDSSRITAAPDGTASAATPDRATSPSAATRSWSRFRLRRTPVAILVAAVLVAVLIVVVQGTWTATPTAASGPPAMLTYSGGDAANAGDAEPAAATLRAAATIAAAQKARDATEGTIQHVVTYGWLGAFGDDKDANELIPTQTSKWLSADGSMRVTQQRMVAMRADGTLDPHPVGGTEATDEFPAGSFPADLAATVTRDPATVLDALAAGFVPGSAGCGSDTSCRLSTVQTLFESYVVPPDLAAAVWTALLDDEDLRSLGTTTDRLGRPALAIAMPATSTFTGTVLLISTETGQMSGWEMITLDPSLLGVAPAVLSFESVSTVEWVDEFVDD